MSGKVILKISLISLAIILGVAFRANMLGAECLWFDEIFSVHAATQPWDNFLSFIALDLIHPPLFYFALRGWVALGGDSPEWLRTLPLITWLIALIPFSLLARELKFNFNSYLFSSCYLIFSGSILKYSIEVRMYSLMLCLSLFSAWIFTRYLNRGGGIVALVAINSALVYTHYFGWFVISAELLIAVFLNRERLKSALVMAGVTFALFLPWIITVWNASNSGEGLQQNIGWMSRPGLVEIIKYILNLVEPFYFQTTTAEPLSVWWITMPLLMVVFAGSAIAILGKEVKESRPILILAILAIVPMMIAFAVSWVSPYSIWGTRHLIVAFAPAYLLIGTVIFGHSNIIFRRVMGGMFLVIFAAAAFVSLARERPAAAWCQVSLLSRDLYGGQTPVYTVEDLVSYQIWFDSRNEKERRPVNKLVGIDEVKEDTAYFLPRGFSDVRTVEISSLDEQTFWFIVRGKVLSETEQPIRNLKVKGYQIRDRRVAGVGGEQIGAYLMER
jgi:uncharacterized membrane protein